MLCWTDDESPQIFTILEIYADWKKGHRQLVLSVVFFFTLVQQQDLIKLPRACFLSGHYFIIVAPELLCFISNL